MFRIYWVSILAVIGWLAVSPALADQQVSGEGDNQTAPGKQDSTSQKLQSWHPDLVDWLSAKLGVTGCGPYAMDRLGYAKERTENQYYDACDLEAQESVANSTRWLLLIALAQTALGIVGTVFVMRSLKLNRDSVNAALGANANALKAIDQEQVNAKRQLRAYVLVNKARVENFGEGKRPKIIVNIKNTGQTPAKDLTTLIGGFSDIFPTRNRFEINYLGPLHSSDVGAGEYNTLTHNFPKVLDVHRVAEISKGTAAIWGYGIVRYKDVFDETHQTRFRLYFGGNFGVNKDGRMAFDADGNDGD